MPSELFSCPSLLERACVSSWLQNFCHHQSSLVPQSFRSVFQLPFRHFYRGVLCPKTSLPGCPGCPTSKGIPCPSPWRHMLLLAALALFQSMALLCPKIPKPGGILRPSFCLAPSSTYLVNNKLHWFLPPKSLKALLPLHFPSMTAFFSISSFIQQYLTSTDHS